MWTRAGITPPLHRAPHAFLMRHPNMTLETERTVCPAICLHSQNSSLSVHIHLHTTWRGGKNHAVGLEMPTWPNKHSTVMTKQWLWLCRRLWPSVTCKKWSYEDKKTTQRMHACPRQTCPAQAVKGVCTSAFASVTTWWGGFLCRSALIWKEFNSLSASM